MNMQKLIIMALFGVSAFGVSALAAEEPICCKDCPENKHKYYSIANDSGPWLCGETCIRNFFYPIFHIFEKNLTKSSWTNSPCADAGYTIYKETVTHGGGGLYCTLDLYACNRTDGCPHPGDDKKEMPKKTALRSGNKLEVCKYVDDDCTEEIYCKTYNSGSCNLVPNNYRTTSERVTCDNPGSSNSKWKYEISPYNPDCTSVLYTNQGEGPKCQNRMIVKC